MIGKYEYDDGMLAKWDWQNPIIVECFSIAYLDVVLKFDLSRIQHFLASIFLRIYKYLKPKYISFFGNCLCYSS